MELTMLGTGKAFVTECYNTCFVLSEDNKNFMVDGGGGNEVLRQLKNAGLDWMDIKEIFVTHKHMDHVLGILWMIRRICNSMKAGEYKGEVNIYGHEDVILLITNMAVGLLQEAESRFIDKRLHLVIVEDGGTKIINGRQVTFFDIHSTKAKQFGFMMDLKGGEKLTCCGDEPYNESERKYAENSTWLLHEAFCLHSQADLFHPYEKHHSTVKDACEQAERLNVQNLLLYHTEDKNIARRKELYMAEGKQYFSGNLFVPDDLETLVI